MGLNFEPIEGAWNCLLTAIAALNLHPNRVMNDNVFLNEEADDRVKDISLDRDFVRNLNGVFVSEIARGLENLEDGCLKPEHVILISMMSIKLLPYDVL